MKKHTNIVTLPKALPKRSYITRSGGSWHPGDIALCFALVIRFEDSADALRKLARRLVDKVCLEHQPNATTRLYSRTTLGLARSPCLWPLPA